MTTDPRVHALTAAEFQHAATAAGYVPNPDPCDVPGKPLTPLEDAICAYITAREALHAANAIVRAATEPDRFRRDARFAARAVVSLRHRRATYLAARTALMGQLPDFADPVTGLHTRKERS